MRALFQTNENQYLLNKFSIYYLNVNTNRPVIMGLKINTEMCCRQSHVYRECMLHVSGDTNTYYHLYTAPHEGNCRRLYKYTTRLCNSREKKNPPC